MQKAFRNYSLLTFFLLTYIFSTAQREAIKPVDVKGETTTTSTKPPANGHHHDNNNNN